MLEDDQWNMLEGHEPWNKNRRQIEDKVDGCGGQIHENGGTEKKDGG